MVWTKKNKIVCTPNWHIQFICWCSEWFVGKDSREIIGFYARTGHTGWWVGGDSKQGDQKQGSLIDPESQLLQRRQRSWETPSLGRPIVCIEVAPSPDCLCGRRCCALVGGMSEATLLLYQNPKATVPYLVGQLCAALRSENLSLYSHTVGIVSANKHVFLITQPQFGWKELPCGAGRWQIRKEIRKETTKTTILEWI